MTRILAAITFVTWLSHPAFAEDAVPATAAEPRIRVQAQFELLPGGSGVMRSDGVSHPMDMTDTYAIGGSVEYVLTPHLSIGVAPRLVYNVVAKGDPAADKELDLRACIRGRSAVSPGFEVYASFTPGYATLRSGWAAVYRSKGFAIGGAIGFTYDLSSSLFVGGEIGFQRSFTTTTQTLAEDVFVYDLELSYAHLGMGAGMRF